MCLGVRGLARRGPNCSTCRLGLAYPQVISELHRLSFAEGVGATELRKWLGKKLGRLEERLPHARSIGRHLSTHAVAEDFRSAEAPPPIGAGGEPGTDELWVLFERLRRRVAALEEDPSALLDDDGRVDPRRLASLVSLTESARRTLEAVNKRRAADVFVVRALQMAFETLVEELKPFSIAVGEAHRVAREMPGAEELADRLEAIFGRAGQRAIREAVRAAMAKTAEQHRLTVGPFTRHPDP